MFRVKHAFLFLLLLQLHHAVKAQVPAAQPDTISKTIDQSRLLLLGGGFAAGYTGLLVSLNSAWYKKQERTGFHFFNDNGQWKQVDKVGHFWGAFHQSRAGIDLLRWAGLAEKKAVLWGGLLGLVLQTPIEVFDGYQSAYGASVGDMAANTFGAAAVVAQELAWHEVRIMPKFSFSRSPYAAYRPQVLGSSLAEQALKDYNGQTYWLSVDIGAFLQKDTRYPGWLNLALGYGAQEMVYNHEAANQAAGFTAYRQFYLSPDLNLMHFRGRNKAWNTALYVLSIFKLPAPALEYNNRQGFTFHPLYF